MKMMKRFLLLFFALTAFSCTSLQQDVNIEQVSYSDEVLSFEARMAYLDADSFLPNIDDETRNLNAQKIEKFIAEIELALSDKSIQKAARARLFALEGKALFINGKKGKASSMYEKSISEYKGDTEAVILAYRLGILENENIEEKANEVAEKDLLVLESALAFYSQKKYADSVAKFDEAFLSLDDFYKDSYRKIRDLAWSLRNVDSSSETADLLSLPEITVSQMLSIAKSKSDFLYNLAGGKKMSDREFYYRAFSSGLLNSASAESSAVDSETIVSKILSARFLWNLYNAKKNNDNLRKYSEKMKKSPVQDLPLDSPDFDAVLGCVENEFMSLEDGRNFKGEKNVTGVDFDSYIEKMENTR